MLVLYGLVGVIGGLSGAALTGLVELASTYLLHSGTGIHPFNHAKSAEGFRNLGVFLPQGRHWLVLLLPALGGAGVGLLASRLAPQLMRGGVGSVVNAFHHQQGKTGRLTTLLTPIAAALTIGSGGSAGVEGPVGRMSAGFGTWIGRQLGLRDKELRILLMAGLAAGIGGVFHAPMAAAIFAAEVLYADLDMDHEVLVPAIIASTISYGVYGRYRAGSRFSSFRNSLSPAALSSSRTQCLRSL